MSNLYLQHHGIKGQRWGVRRYQNADGSYTNEGLRRYRKSGKFNEDGSKKTNKHLHRIMSLDKKYAVNRTAHQQMKINREIVKYNKSAKKDISIALKEGNIRSAKSISSGRTYMKFLTDGSYLQRALADIAKSSNAQVGEKYTYNFLRDPNFGGVKVTVNDRSEYYTLDPIYDRHSHRR